MEDNKVAFCMRCFSNSAVPITDKTNFCHYCGSEGTCVELKEKDAKYLRENIQLSIKNLDIFLVTRMENGSWGDTIQMTIVAKDEKHAERKARITNSDLKKTKLKVDKIDLTQERVIISTHVDEFASYTPSKEDLK